MSRTQEFSLLAYSLFKSQLVKDREDLYRKRLYGGNSSQSSSQSFSLGGGNRTTGFRGHFQPHLGGCGRGNPSPNDSLQASLSPPVGGHLNSFRRDWLANKCSNNVLNIITNGYILTFTLKPNLARPFKETKLWPLVSSLFCQRRK